VSAKLDGSYSGLWVCDLCGHTGDECHCEHFNRGTGAHGPDKTLTEPELAAEYWRLTIAWYRTGLEEYKDQSLAVLNLIEDPIALIE
jgi:hypothetical protein